MKTPALLKLIQIMVELELSDLLLGLSSLLHLKGGKKPEVSFLPSSVL